MPEKYHPLHQFKFCPKCGSDKFSENNFKSNKCGACGFTYYFNSSAASVAVIINQQREVLVATRAHEPAKGTYDLPGGFVDMEESAEQAVVREVKEETNLDVISVRYLFSLPNKYVYSGFQVETLDLFFLCEFDQSGVFTANDDVAKLKFIPVEELDPEKFGMQSVKNAIEKIQSINL